MRGKTERLDNILQHILLKHGYAESIKLQPVREFVKDYFNDENGDQVKVVSIKKNILTLSLSSSTLLYEVKYFKYDDLKKRLNELAGIKIKDLCLVLDNCKYGK